MSWGSSLIQIKPFNVQYILYEDDINSKRGSLIPQEEREELWKTVMAFHSHQKSDMAPIHHRLDSLEKRTSDIEKHLQSRDPDTRIPANDRLEELERRACELEKQVKKQHTHFLHGPHQVNFSPNGESEESPS